MGVKDGHELGIVAEVAEGGCWLEMEEEEEEMDEEEMDIGIDIGGDEGDG